MAEDEEIKAQQVQEHIKNVQARVTAASKEDFTVDDFLQERRIEAIREEEKFDRIFGEYDPNYRISRMKELDKDYNFTCEQWEEAYRLKAEFENHKKSDQ